MKDIKYSWEDFDNDIKEIIDKISFLEYDMLIGIAKGGLPLLTKLANITGLPYRIIECKSYLGRVQKETNLRFPEWPCSERGINRPWRVLILDDIADSGKTLKKVINHFEKEEIEVHILTLFYKEKSKIEPDFWIRKVPNNTWVKFCWE